jgi:peroxin-5
MENATAWFELGVKQQENEREYKALQALKRAVELDPSHLPAWLALAISYANDSNRRGTYEAIFNWVSRNTKYQDVFQQYFLAPNVSSPPAEQNSHLIQCLIAMARSNISGEIDADIQVALAVLLNTNEVCFDFGYFISDLFFVSLIL